MPKKSEIKTVEEAIQKNEFVESIEKSLKTPIVKLKYCYLAKPFFYPGSHVPRYSITLLFDKQDGEQRKFLESIEKIATQLQVETLGYIDEGLISLKFQGKDCPQLFSIEKGKKQPKNITLQHDLPEGIKAQVEFELNTYFNKKTQKKGFNFCPRKVTFHLCETENEEKKSDGNNQNSGHRPRVKNNGFRGRKLPSRKKRGLGK